jgi:hypothetical protein
VPIEVDAYALRSARGVTYGRTHMSRRGLISKRDPGLENGVLRYLGSIYPRAVND